MSTLTSVSNQDQPQSEARLARRAREFEIVTEVGSAISTILDLETLLQTVSDLTKSEFNLYHAHVYLLDPERETLVLTAGAGEVGQIMKARKRSISLHAERSLVARAARTHDSVVIDDVTNEADFLPNPLLPDTRSEMAVPMLVGTNLVGVLDVQASIPARFDADDMRVFKTLASQIAVAAQNARQFEQIRHAAERSALLADYNTALSVARDEHEILLAASLFAQNYQVAFAVLVYFDQRAGELPHQLHMVATIDGKGQTIPVSAERLASLSPSQYPLFQTIIASPDAPFISEDIEHDSRIEEDVRAPSLLNGVRALVIMPLKLGEQWLGALVFNWTQPQVFNSDLRTLLQDLMPTTRSAVANRRQYLATLEAEKRSQDLSRRLQIAAEIGAVVTNILDLDEMLQTTADLVKTRYAHYHAHVYILEGERLVIAAGAGEPGRVMKARGHAIPLSREHSLVARAARTKRPAISNNVANERDYLPNPLLPNTHSEMAVPMIVNESVVGVLDIQSSLIDAFYEDDAFINSTLATQIAASLQTLRTLQEVTRAREEVARIYDLSVDMIGTASHEGYFKQLNPAWMNTLGWSYEELTAKPFISFVHPDDVQPTLDEYARQIGIGAASVSFENRYLCKDGSYRWLSWNAVPNAAENTTYFVVRDVTLDKAIASAVAKRARELEIVAEVGTAITTILDRNELLQTVADLTKDKFSLYHTHVYLYSESQNALVLAAGAGATGRMMKERGHRISASHPHSLVARSARNRAGVLSNNVTREPDFLPNPLLPETRSELAVPMLIGDQVVGVLDFQAEIFNRFDDDDIRVMTTLASQIAVAVENANSVEQLVLNERAIENSTSGLTIVDAQRPGLPLIYSNPAFVQMSGFTLNDLMGKPLTLLQGPEPEQPGMEELHAAIKDGRQAIVTLRAYRKDGTWFINEMRTSPIYNQRGDLTHFVVVHTDITERIEIEARREALLHQAEEQAERERNAAERLREVDRLKSQFLANMSHELRTPLNSIIGYSEILLDGDDGVLSDEALEDVETIHSSGHHLLALINDVLDLAKIEAGEMRLDRRPIEVAKIVGEVVHTSQVLAKTKMLDLKFTYEDGLPEITADPIRLRQIMTNLIGNAIKFTEQGSVSVHVCKQSADVVEVSVTDTGIGMKKEHIPLIFQQFRQVDGSSTRRAGGTGLGLTITRYLINMHGGEINVESELGIGSTFRFTMPVVQTQPA